jgi:hypothetical protein
MNMDIWGQIQEAEELHSFEPLPAGLYSVAITDASSNEDQTGNPYVKAEYTVLAGEYMNRKIWDNMYLYNSSYPGLQKQGLSKLKRLSDIKGIVLRGDADIANFIGMEVTLSIKQYKNKNDQIKNDVQDINLPLDKEAPSPVIPAPKNAVTRPPMAKKASPFG